MRGILISAVAAAMVLTTATAPAAHAKINIGVAPSPNGFVMLGVPTQIAVSGTKAAVLSLWNSEQKKYFRIGTARNGQALAYTFPTGGVQKLVATPLKGKARTFTVGVYSRQSGFSGTTPTAFGALVLPSNQTIGYFVAGSSDDGINRSVTASASEGCVLVDIGAKTDGEPITVTVRSTSADPVTATATRDTPIALTGVPVKGDMVIDFKYQGQAHAVWSRPAPGMIGAMTTCLSPT
jgi:hypothetical protein